MIDRRTVIAGSAALLMAARVAAQAQTNPRPVALDRIASARGRGRAGKRLDILVLGGTVFVGPAVVKAALARGHRVTLFNRGRSNPGLFPQVERLRGDRLAGAPGLEALGSRKFDAVVDTWADAAAMVDVAARRLSQQADRYLYVSSISAYDPAAWRAGARITEDSPRIPLPDGFSMADPDARYGARKRASEDAAMAAFGDRLAIVRAHQILGYHIARESAGQRYWPMRFAQGGEILVPGDGEDRTQFIDVGDLGAFIVHLLETRAPGAFNSMRTLSWRDYAAQLSALSPQPPTLRWADHERLAQAQVRPMADLPMWVPRQRGPGFMGHVSDRADAAGLIHRPSPLLWRDIVEGTRDAFPEGFAFQPSKTEAPLTLSRERELLAQFVPPASG